MRVLTILLTVALLVVPAAASAQTFTGSLSTPSGVYATPLWDHANGGFKISWEITKMVDGSWCYDYSLTNASGGDLQRAPSHMVLEISPNATAADFWNVKWNDGAPEDWEVNTYSGADPSNPGMPGAAYGIKIDANGDTKIQNYSFYSTRAPTWGDFYSKDGNFNQNPVYAYNMDFLDPDPLDPAQSGLLTDAAGAEIYKILRPDTQTDIVPEPATMLLFGTGLAGLGILRRRKASK